MVRYAPGREGRLTGAAADTIVARATAPGRGGIGIVRVSGPLVRDIAVRMLGRLPAPRYATFSDFMDADGEALDSGIAIFFPAPQSFTGEDVLEFQGHGGPVVLDLLLDRILGLGARMANPGEFSQRAFLNNKLDLAQAEAIADLINSGTAAAARGAMRSLQGAFSRKINSLLTKVIELRVFVEASMDFPEEEIDGLSDERITSQLGDLAAALEDTLARASDGALLSEGASVVLIGKPNVGKSSLMNALTGRDTSIVTDIPGTTRDLVDEVLQLDGIPLRLIDTAGIRESGDAIEAEGVRRAFAAEQQADLVITLIDASDAPLADLAALDSSLKTLLVLNKVDLVPDPSPLAGKGVLISAKTGAGLPALKAALKRELGLSGNIESNFTARRRHIDALTRAARAVTGGKSVLAKEGAGELLAEELRVCQQCLAEITGEFSADDLLGEIFASFCIGK